MKRFRFLFAGALLAVAGGANAISINFDNLASGTVVTNQYFGATFSSSAGQETRALGVNEGTSLPNILVTAAVGGAVNRTSNVIVSFSMFSFGVSFKVTRDDVAGHAADVRVFADHFLVATLPLNVDGVAGPDLFDMSGFTGLTSIEIVSVTDPGGLGFDDFNFNVPEPGTLLVFAVGLAALAFKRRL